MTKKPFLFISDFDGTLTDKDFFHIMIDSYFQDKKEELYKAWDSKQQTDIDFLSHLFQSIGRSEEEIMEDIINIPFDPYAKTFIEKVKDAGGDFVVISAGSDYYIKRLFEHLGIKGVDVYSNEGRFQDNGIQLTVKKDHPHYSEMYGIDKAKVTKDLASKGYEKVYFAGDTAPDLKAALTADVTFAKGKLISLLEDEKHPFIPIKNYKDIHHYFIEEGVFKNENV
ncbi:MtnX-like HAD-IB family phosphatase [Terrilactibacillus sp. BCM23-1]|uniref:MtnX-like HAD-IB family phosphatase n=1 Tax=Terrilactibacillus tamarindi TaxID=2599694 RepID=A0A6N8CR26_9BACI|nr:MtnX-like HAD-IB family phosphatase [Terrilactibacillus tamarindi]MTT31533.1 MtnX-like HAD-IB family phosphatase [Terrilactibacillus tamarindi]